MGFNGEPETIIVEYDKVKDLKIGDIPHHIIYEVVDEIKNDNIIVGLCEVEIYIDRESIEVTLHEYRKYWYSMIPLEIYMDIMAKYLERHGYRVSVDDNDPHYHLYTLKKIDPEMRIEEVIESFFSIIDDFNELMKGLEKKIENLIYSEFNKFNE